jgi:hypothetical protein
MPEKKKRTSILIQARIKPSLLACPLQYLTKDGFQYKNKQELLVACLTLLNKILETNVGLPKIDDEEWAESILELYFSGETTFNSERISVLKKILAEKKKAGRDKLD